METVPDFNLLESSMTITTLERSSLEDWSKLSAAEKALYESPVTLSCSCSPTDTICIDTTHSPINAIVNIDTIPPKIREGHHPIKITDCPKCNSNLPISKTSDKGICKCEYCGKEVYVW